MQDFFVSYNRHDRQWAEWIAWQLEDDGFSVVIQAWDFTGNWVEAMDRAMRESRRTIAVLSQQYLDALYTRSEWADAYRRDPTGEHDLLVPVKVAPAAPTGILAQIVHVDLTDVPEDEARSRLLARAHGQRGKPVTAPGFPGGGMARVEHHAVTRRPPYPAAQEDTEQLRLARDLLIAFRGQFSARMQELKDLGTLARGWSRVLPEDFDDAVYRTIVVAAEVADAMRRLPVSRLEFARAYGLGVHETVFWGQALTDAEHQRSMFDAPARAAMALDNKERKQLGMPPGGDPTPNAYGFEMLARVLESATGLLAYDVSRLPRGFLPPPAVAPHAVTDLRSMQGQGLFMAQVDDEPGLRLMTAGAQPSTHAAFAARTRPLHTLAARCNSSGALDLVADDGQHRYYFADSASAPTAQSAARSWVLDARFLSDAPGGPVAMLLGDGSVGTLDGNGVQKTLREPPAWHNVADACLWIDPLAPGMRRVLSATSSDWSVTSTALDGSDEVTRSGEELWNAPAFDAAFGHRRLWTGAKLTLARLQGLDCLLARQSSQNGVKVQFLDPRSLVAMRRPLPLQGFAVDMTIACGRWLVVAFLQDSEPRRLGVWDLQSAGDTPVTLACAEKGDCYNPFVVAETATGFRTLQVFRTLNMFPTPNRFELLAFEGPAGAATPLLVCEHLRLWPLHV